MAAETERPEPVILAPGITTTADVQGGEPCIAGSRITTSAPYAVWREEGPEGARDAYPSAAALDIDRAITFEAGRRYGERHDRADRTRRRLRTIEDADAWKRAGYAEGLAAAAEYLRASGRGDWAVVLTATLRERQEG